MKLARCYIAGLFLTLTAFAAEPAGITYDVRVFEVHTPVTNAKFESNYDNTHGFRSRIYALQKNGWTADSGLPLNNAGDILFWDKADAPKNPGLIELASNDSISDGSTLSVQASIPVQYLAMRTDGRYDMKTESIESGINVRIKYIGQNTTLLQFKDSRAIKREEMRDIQLDVGKPLRSGWSSYEVHSPIDAWDSCLIVTPEDGAQPPIAILARLHASPEALVAAEKAMSVGMYTISFRYWHLTPKAKQKLTSNLVIDDEFKTMCGEAQRIKSFELAGQTYTPGSGAVERAAGKIKGTEFVSAPRVSTLAASYRQAPSMLGGVGKSNSGPSTPTPKSPTENFWQRSPLLSAFMEAPKPHCAIVCDIKTTNDDWSGIASAISVDAGGMPDTASIEMASVARTIGGREGFAESGFYCALQLTLGVPAWFLFPERDGKGSYFVEVTVTQ